MKETLDALQKSVPTLDSFVSLGLLEKADDGSYRQKPAAAPAQQKSGEKAPEPEWKAAVDELKKSLKGKEDELAAERQRAAEIEKKNAVSSALAKAGAVNPERDAVHMLAGIQRNESGAYVARSKDELGLDVEVGIDDFIVKFLNQNPELKRATGHTGSGTPAGSATTASGAATASDYMANRQKYLAGGMKVVF
jgi:hypothetical protein